MDWKGWVQAARWVAPLTALALLAACDEPPVADGPQQPDCAEGTLLDPESNACVAEGQRCGAGEMPLAGGGCVQAGWASCPAGFERDETGFGCLDVLPEGDCPAGTMPVLGERTCQPVGTGPCPDGFEQEPSGWGCREVMPEKPCTGATMEVLGKRDCQPVGDCGAAFPPAGATHFVDPTLVQEDATHFRTISAALDAAPSGAVVAIHPGTYRESLRPARPVRLVGKCAAEVVLDGGTYSYAGVSIVGTSDVQLEGLTLTRHKTGVFVDASSGVRIARTVIDNNRNTGVTAGTSKSTVELLDSVVRNTLPAAGTRVVGYGVEATFGARATVRGSVIAGNHKNGVVVGEGASAITIERSIVRDTKMDSRGEFGIGVHVRTGGLAEVRESALVGNHESAVLVYSADSQALLERSVLRDTRLSNFNTGAGIYVVAGRASLEGVTIARSHAVGIFATEASTVEVKRSVVSETREDAAGENGTGIWVRDGASVTATGTALVRNTLAAADVENVGSKLVLDASLALDTLAQKVHGAARGVGAFDRGAVTVKGTAFVGNKVHALEIDDPGTSGTLERLVVLKTGTGPNGTTARGIAVQNGASATVVDSVFAANEEYGFVVNQGAKLSMSRVVVRDGSGRSTDGSFGRGGSAVTGGELLLEDCALLRNKELELLVSGQGTRAAVRRCLFAGTMEGATANIARGLVCQRSAQAEIANAVLLDVPQIALFAGDAARLDATDVHVRRVGKLEDDYGYGSLAYLDGVLNLRRTTIEEARGAAVFISNASGVLERVLLRSNATAVHVDGASVEEVEQAPAESPSHTLSVTRDTELIANKTRQGSGNLPIPEPLVQ